MHVVLLLGSSTAGKSTLCNELVREHKWHTNSFDEAGAKVMEEYVKPSMIRELKSHNLITTLDPLMTESEVLKLASRFCVNISKGPHHLNHQFANSDLENLESLLKAAGFEGEEIPDLAKNLRAVAKIGMDIYTKKEFPEPLDKLYEETFKKANSEHSIILDVIPVHNMTAAVCLEHFESWAKKYRVDNPTELLTTSVVFAYCSPQTLSERILERNRKAEEKDNSSDKRVGLFPFEQLATLVSAEEKFDDSSANNFSRTELFYMINRHANTDKIGNALFLEDPVDPDILLRSQDEKTTAPKMTGNKLDPAFYLDNDEHSSERPRIGSKKTIEEYNKLANKFGFFKDKEKFSLNIISGISFDAVVNTGRGSPSELAIEFLDKIRNDKITPRITKL